MSLRFARALSYTLESYLLLLWFKNFKNEIYTIVKLVSLNTNNNLSKPGLSQYHVAYIVLPVWKSQP